MNKLFFRDMDIGSLLNMENMNAGFIAEGLTSRKRAIAEYMRESGTPDDKKALKLLKEIEDLEGREYSREHDEDDIRAKIRRVHEGLVRLSGERRDEGKITYLREKECPLAIYALARLKLHPGLGYFNLGEAWGSLVDAIRLGFEPAQSLYAELALRKHLSLNEERIIGLLKSFLYDPPEDLLLVMGRRLALWECCDEEVASTVRKWLKGYAEDGHVDALRMLALSHSANVKPETIWAREEIAAQAKRGKAYAMLIMAQHLAGRFLFWLPDGGRMESLQKARILLEKRARKKDDWATLLLAYTWLPVESREAPGEEHDVDKALGLLETLANERDFPPAKAMLGAWIYRTTGDVEAAWPSLHDACASVFSRACEAACADLFISVLLNAWTVELIREVRVSPSGGKADHLEEKFEGTFVDDDHGGSKFWIGKMRELSLPDGLGLVDLTYLRREFTRMPFFDGSFDMNDATRYLAANGDPCVAVHCYLYNLALEDTDRTLRLRALIETRIEAGAGMGVEDCVLANILFTKVLFDQGENPWPMDELWRMAVGFATASRLARMVGRVIRVLFLLDAEHEGLPFNARVVELELALLNRDYTQATLGIDLPVICAMPVLLKYAQTRFCAEVVRRAVEEISLALHGQKMGFAGFVTALNRYSGIQGPDMRHLWENLGLKRDVDFRPLPASTQSSAEARQSRKDAARKKARRKQAKKSRKKR